MKNKLLPLISVAFPGAYKLLVVLLATYFAGQTVANEFSQAFFWVALLVTFSGIPVTALMISPSYSIRLQDKLALTLLSSVCGFLLAYAVQLKDHSLAFNLSVLLGTLLLSGYEINKRILLNADGFLSLVKASFVTLALFSGLFYFCYHNAQQLIILAFSAMLLPVAYLVLGHHSGVKNLHYSRFSVLAKDFAKHCFSNMTSPSLMFALPILLVNELGENSAVELVQVFYISSLAYLFPRAIAEKNIPDMRNNGIKGTSVYFYFKIIALFVLVLAVFAGFGLAFVYGLWPLYLLLFIAMQISQLSLPFSNVLLVSGDINSILKINLASACLLVLLAALTLFFFEPGQDRALILLLDFLIFQLVKLLLNAWLTRKYLQPGIYKPALVK
ncbi:hypothetical protein [Thalassomonas haliotis]|uniref:Polysaccharide biosynthesis protein n=1 Tax=Thalassomonas haliotis TaxID=485448 RepID=A0ABY7VH36_9GAMM|nr:hypothetical protein [Thalassomonas haliotis]WDE12783.1 hypothetical protein H3N35_04740 [Thalassomonas haliotis]